MLSWQQNMLLGWNADISPGVHNAPSAHSSLLGQFWGSRHISVNLQQRDEFEG